MIPDDANTLGVTQVLCAFKNSIGKTCPDSKPKTETVPHLSTCYDRCLSDTECLVFAFDADSGTCEHFSTCERFVPSVHPNSRVFMMNDNLNYPQDFTMAMAEKAVQEEEGLR